MFDFTGGWRSGRIKAPRLGDLPHSFHPGWPEATASVLLPNTWQIRLRPLCLRDRDAWIAQRISDQQTLQAVEPTSPIDWELAHTKAKWWPHFMALRSDAQAGALIPMVIEVNGQFAGQLTLGGINRGALLDCWIGYWLAAGFRGHGVGTAAVALGTDHAFSRVGLHRVTATYLPDNPASGKVLHANGFRDEGYFVSNIHINGEWRDHHFVALTADEFDTTCVGRLREVGRIID